MGFKIDIKGKKFGQWTVLEYHGIGPDRMTRLWLCKCSCGRIDTISRSNLTSGGSTKCMECGIKARRKKSRKEPLPAKYAKANDYKSSIDEFPQVL